MNETRRQLAANLFRPSPFSTSLNSPSPDGDALANALLFEQRLARALMPPATPQRRRIWELAGSLHCSIIGTCLSTGELRQLLVKLNLPGAAKANDHDLHGQGVSLAGERGSGAKLLQKTLDRRHHATIGRFEKAQGEAALREMWQDALQRGDIPGAYWATLTHPSASQDLIRAAFGDVHMLSHLVGASNRADIHRLRQLEADKALLEDKVAKQQERLREAFLERDATVQSLNRLLAERLTAQPTQDAEPVRAALEKLIVDLKAQLNVENARRLRAEERQEALQQELVQATGAAKGALALLAALQTEIAETERGVAALAARDTDNTLSRALDGLCLLYVGGKGNLLPPMKAIAERQGGTLLHHDGGLETSLTLLPGMVARADVVLFPVDCISHEAALAVKRFCRQAGKRYLPLRSAGLSSFVAALQGVPGAEGVTTAAAILRSPSGSASTTITA